MSTGNIVKSWRNSWPSLRTAAVVSSTSPVLQSGKPQSSLLSCHPASFAPLHLFSSPAARILPPISVDTKDDISHLKKKKQRRVKCALSDRPERQRKLERDKRFKRASPCPSHYHVNTVSGGRGRGKRGRELTGSGDAALEAVEEPIDVVLGIRRRHPHRRRRARRRSNNSPPSSPAPSPSV